MESIITKIVKWNDPPEASLVPDEGEDLREKKKKPSLTSVVVKGFSKTNKDGSKKSQRDIYNDKTIAIDRVKQVIDKTMHLTTQFSSIFLSLSSLRHEPGKIQFIAAGTQITNILYSQLISHKIALPDYVDPLDLYMTKLGGKWVALETNKFRIVQILNQNELGTLITEEKTKEQERGDDGYQTTVKTTEKVYHATVEGCDIIWKQANYDNSDPWPKRLCVREEQQEEVFKALGNLVWASYGTNHLSTVVVTAGSGGKRSGASVYGKSGLIEFMEDVFATDILPSAIGDKIANNTKRFLEVPEITTRAILLYGPPGTGKSTAARYIAHLLKFRSLRISYDLLNQGNVLVQCLDILRPDVIIIDDIDRSPHDGYLLQTLELLRKRTRVIIASANYPGNLDYAVLRPGRFDEAIKIHILDDEVIRRTLGKHGVSDKVFQELKGLPIAYINEYSLRKKVLGEEEAAAAIKELYERIELGRNENDEEMEEKYYGKKKAKKKAKKKTKKKVKKKTKKKVRKAAKSKAIKKKVRRKSKAS